MGCYFGGFCLFCCFILPSMELKVDKIGPFEILAASILLARESRPLAERMEC